MSRFCGVTRLAVVLVAAAAAVAGCGNGSRRDAVDDYFRHVREAQARHAEDITRVNDAYASFGKQHDVKAVRAAERSIRELRAEIAKLDAPEDAEAIRRDLVRVLDRQVALAHEVVRLEEFLPPAQAELAAVTRANAAFRRAVARRPSQAQQRDALAAYAARLAAIEMRFARLRPPPALVPWARAQRAYVARLQRSTAELHDALVAGSRPRLALALGRFRAIGARRPGVDRAQRDAVLVYNRRVGGIVRLQARIERERRALEQRLG